MIGYNSRETFQDATYDVQTQQLSGPDRSIETHVYRNGKIIATVRSYTAEDAPMDALEERMSQQHEEVCGKVREGTYELVFLWISRGIIAFESQDYLQSLECFESVLTIEETHAEANAYLDKIRSSLKKDAPRRRRVLEEYQEQIKTLEASNRIIEASRKRAILTKICTAPAPSEGGRSVRPRPGPGRLKQGAFPGNALRQFRSTLLPRIREELLPVVKTTLERGAHRIREDWIPYIRENLLPKIRDNLLPKIRENLFSRYVLVTLATVVLTVLSGLIAADLQVRLDPVYHSSLGKEYLEENRTVAARNLFYGVLRQDPDSREALEGFWQTFRQEGDYAKAVEILQSLVESRDSVPQFHFYLAEACRLSSRYEEAVPHYEEAVNQGFPEVPCKIGMGLCLVAKEDPAAAISLWEGLLKRGADDYRVDYCLGRAYQMNGRLGRASVHYSRALQKHPESAAIYRALADCLYGLHQQEKAEALWRKAASLESTGSTEKRCPEGPERGEDAPQHSVGTCFPFPLT